MQEAELDDLGEVLLIYLAEVSEVVRKLLSGKVLGVDVIHPEMLKAFEHYVVWRLETVPLDWQTRMLVPILKKGDQKVCSTIE